jgi:type IV pilus assembly protein PilA
MNRAFTLIEMLVVVAVIGILAAVVLASLGGAKSQGNDTAVKGDLGTILTQAVLYYGIGNTYCGQASQSCIDNPSTVYVSGSAGCTTDGTVFKDSQSNGLTSSIENAITTAQKNAGGSANVICQMKSQQFLVAAKLSNTHWWCIDYAGASKEETTKPAASKTACP